MNAPINRDATVFDAQSLQAIERDVDCRFLPTIRAYQRAIKVWVATVTDLELREHAAALLLKMELIAGQEETAATTESWSEASVREREAA
jgi:hypothetical protein